MVEINKLYDDSVIDAPNPFFDLRIHTFHRVDYFTGEQIERDRQTYNMMSLERIIVKCGISLTLSVDVIFSIHTRLAGAKKDGLIVLNAPMILTSKDNNKELEIILYNSSDSVLLLQKGYRIATGIILPRPQQLYNFISPSLGQGVEANELGQLVETSLCPREGEIK